MNLRLDVIGLKLRPNTCITLGDSMTAQGTANTNAPPDVNWRLSSRGYFNYANQLLGKRFKLIRNAGVGGDTPAMMLLRVDADVIDYNPGHCFILGFINNVTGTVNTQASEDSIYATTIADLGSIYARLSGAGIFIHALTQLGDSNISNPVNNAQANIILRVNKWINDYFIGSTAGMCHDAFSVTVDPTSAIVAAKANFLQADGLHPSKGAAWTIGKLIYNNLNTLLPKVPDRIASNANVWNSGANSHLKQLVLNPAFTGIGGTNLIGAGSVPTSWIVDRTGTTVAAASSIVASTDDVATPWTQLVITGATYGDAVIFYCDLASQLAAVAAGVDTVQGWMEFSVDSSNGLQALELRSRVRVDGVDYWSYDGYNDTDTVTSQIPNQAWSGILQPQPQLIPAGTTIGLMRLAVYIFPMGGSSITIRFRNPSLYKV